MPNDVLFDATEESLREGEAEPDELDRAMAGAVPLLPPPPPPASTIVVPARVNQGPAPTGVLVDLLDEGADSRIQQLPSHDAASSMLGSLDGLSRRAEDGKRAQGRTECGTAPDNHAEPRTTEADADDEDDAWADSWATVDGEDTSRHHGTQPAKGGPIGVDASATPDKEEDELEGWADLMQASPPRPWSVHRLASTAQSTPTRPTLGLSKPAPPRAPATPFPPIAPRAPHVPGASRTAAVPATPPSLPYQSRTPTAASEPEHSSATPRQQQAVSAAPQPALSIAPTAAALHASAEVAEVRPTNIPPPSILLALFPSLLSELRDQCLNARREATGPSRTPDLARLAPTIPLTLRAMVRVLLGRSVRWKRDVHLSQSTRIGPAGAGRGMKLSSVNKNETAREEREAVDVLSRLREVGAVLNSAVAAARIEGVETVRFPPTLLSGDARFAGTVRALGAAGGAIRASHACALCGLKRDERVAKMEDDVFDSFGEWWIDHWGHRDCKWFWHVCKGRLDHR